MLRARNAMLYATTVETPLGGLRLIASDSGLRAVLWPDERPDRIRLEGQIEGGPAHPLLTTAVRQLEEYFRGTRRQFELPLDVVGTEFQKACWAALSKIPYGRTISYAEQAVGIGRPSAVRAVGAANGRNPLSIVVPCHRVVASSGALTGFGGGLEAKQWLLEHEARILAAGG